MRIIDSHTHIYSEAFEGEVDEVLRRATEVGVVASVLPAIDSSTYGAMMAVAQSYPYQAYPAIGLHPTSVNEHYLEELAFVEEHLGDYPFVAIGEIGLDYYWSTTYQSQQISAFERQIRLAERHELPIIVHTRDAWSDTFDTLRRVASSRLRGVFHSFTGTPEELHEALSFEGFMIGINGVVTFKNSSLREYIGAIPLERLLIETDAPYLSPSPLRGQRNEPAHIVHTIEHLAQIWSCSAETIAEHTYDNAVRLFGLQLS